MNEQRDLARRIQRTERAPVRRNIKVQVNVTPSPEPKPPEKKRPPFEINKTIRGHALLWVGQHCESGNPVPRVIGGEVPLPLVGVSTPTWNMIGSVEFGEGNRLSLFRCKVTQAMIDNFYSPFARWELPVTPVVVVVHWVWPAPRVIRLVRSVAGSFGVSVPILVDMDDAEHDHVWEYTVSVGPASAEGILAAYIPDAALLTALSFDSLGGVEWPFPDTSNRILADSGAGLGDPVHMVVAAQLDPRGDVTTQSDQGTQYVDEAVTELSLGIFQAPAGSVG